MNRNKGSLLSGRTKIDAEIATLKRKITVGGMGAASHNMDGLLESAEAAELRKRSSSRLLRSSTHSTGAEPARNRSLNSTRSAQLSHKSSTESTGIKFLALTHVAKKAPEPAPVREFTNAQRAR